jgi:hypothetical protein
VVLAGKANDGVFAQVSQATNEALIEIGNRTMLDYVVSALTSANSIGRCVVVGTPDVARVLPAGVEFVPAGEDVIANVERGTAHLGGDLSVLVVTSDVPFITGEIVDRFVAQCLAKPADLHYPAIPREAAEAKYPGVQRTYVKLREGTFTGGNLFLVSPRVIRTKADQVRAFVAARKSPAKMAGLIGPMFVVKLALGRLSARELEVKISSMFSLRGAVVFTNDAEIGVDVDKLSDLDLAKRVLAG